jgi:hypothetical protein
MANASAEREARFEKGKPADPTANMSPEAAEKWKAMNEEHRDKFKTGEENSRFQAEAEEVVSRFEKDKPADPTENMDPEDAAKWDEENEKNKDKFKTAAAPVFRSVETRDCKLIDRLVSQRGAVDWVTDVRDEKYQRLSEEEGFRERIFPRARESFHEINDFINEAAARLTKRLIAFERGSLPEFEELGYRVKLGKLTPVFGSGGRDWADYDFRQEVSIADKVLGGTDTLRLTWGFRDYVRMSDGGRWTSFDSNRSGGRLTFTEMALTVSVRLHGGDWPGFVAQRKQRMEEKGFKAASTTETSITERVVTRFQKDSSRKPRTVPERHQLKILVDTVKNPLKGKFLGGPTAEEAEETLREKFDYTDAEIRRLKQAKTAGFSYATERMSVLFVQGRKLIPFNIDTIRAINDTWIPIVADDGETHDVDLKVIGHQGSGLLTRQDEQMGVRSETRVDLQIPLDEGVYATTSERAALAALAQVGKKFDFTVEPVRAGYKPKPRTISRFKKVRRPKKFPFR